MIPDFLVWNKDGSQVVLVVQMDGWTPDHPADSDRGLQSFAHDELLAYLSKTSCRHALIVHRDVAFFLRTDSAGGNGPGLQVAARFPTAVLFGAAPQRPNGDGGELLDHRVKSWLERLVELGADVFPGDAAGRNEAVAETVRAAAGGRVVWEMVRECKRRSAANGRRHSSQEVQALLRALEAEWERTGGFDETYLHAFMERFHAGAPR